jgi:adenine-specific DNA glycosylase
MSPLQEECASVHTQLPNTYNKEKEKKKKKKRKEKKREEYALRIIHS